jgi:diguanylate cyclase (GGDEF)-like protein
VTDGELRMPPALTGPAEVQDLRDGMADMVGSLELQRRALDTRAEESARIAARLRQVLGFAREVSSSLTLRYVLETVAVSTRTITEAPRVRIWLLDESDNSVRLAFDTDVDRKAALPDLTHANGIGAVGRAVRYGEVRYSANEEDTDPTVALPSPVVAQPLIVGSRVIGVIEAVVPDGVATLSDEVSEVVETLAGHAATAVEAARMHQRSEELSTSDALTGLANRRRLDQDLELECERAMRYGRPLAFIMLDVDHFKSINDTYGHARGDAVLQELAEVLHEQMRTCDTIYRYGGEEFAVLARETDVEGAGTFAERLRQTVEHRFLRGGQPGITISLGVATLPSQATSSTTLMQLADSGLYQAKRSGRNRVSVAVRSDQHVPA